MKKQAVAFLIISIMLIALFVSGCDKGNNLIIPVVPNYTPTPNAVDTPDPTAPMENKGTESPEETFVSDYTPEPTDIILTVAAAKDIMPVLGALLETQMLHMSGKSMFSVGDATPEVVNKFIYAYAQANAYTADGVMMSEFEVQEAINIAFGNAYTYDRFISDAAAGKIVCTLTDGVWHFETGESYAPTLTYTLNVDTEFLEDKGYCYKYDSAFDDTQGYALVYLVQSENNMTGFSVMSIELSEYAPKQ